MTDHCYTSGQVARLLNIPARTARRYLANGKIPAIQNPITGRWKISWETLAAVMAEYQLPLPELPSVRHVIVVDDEELVVRSISQTLTGAGEELSVEGFASSYEALIRLGSTVPDLVILDSRMPGADGRAVLKAIKSSPATSRTPVLVVSGYPEDLEEMLTLGASAALAKPFSPPQLLVEVQRLLPAAASPRRAPVPATAR